MKPYHRNPRQITDKRYKRLQDTLARLGDLSGIVHNQRTDEIIGGNQRTAVFGQASEIVITERYDHSDEQGTVAHGFVIWRGKKYAYRLVDWDEETAAEANLAANIGAGDWNWDVFANAWEPTELTAWGFDVDLLTDWRRDVAALGSFIASETDTDWGDAFGALPDGERAPFQQMTFTLHDEQVEQVKTALSAAKARGPFDSPNENSNGNALARICEAFVTDYGNG